MHERRYPPTPYRPHSPETEAYRQGWDMGWKHRGLGTAWCKEFLRHTNLHDLRDSTPWMVGWRDGVIARDRAMEREAKAERKVRQIEREARRQAERLAAQEEQPY